MWKQTIPQKANYDHVWVGKPLDLIRLNHQQYCDANGYNYKHFSISKDDFAANYTQKPAAWYVARDLLQFSDADYFFKMDIDCLFARTHVRLESFLDPQEKYSFYITNIERSTRFMQSQSWILKNSDYSRAFVKEWLEYVNWGSCGNLAYEQGALHLTIGTMYSQYLGKNGTKYTCPHYCTFFSSFLLLKGY